MKKQILIGALVLLAAILVVFANPIINTIGNKNVNEGQTLTFNVTTSAPNSGSTTFILTPVVAWATISKVSDTLATVTLSPNYAVVPSSSASQAFDFNVTASDADSTDVKPFTATVFNVNQNPTITSTTLTIGAYDDEITHSIAASDADGDTLTYTLTSAGDVTKANCSLSGSTLTVTRKTNLAATTTCTVQTSDGKGGTALGTYTIDVKKENKLKLTKLKVYVDDDSVSGIDADEISDVINIEDDVYISSKLKVEIELKNMFDDDDDIAIEDITIEGVIVGIDDDDDLEEETDMSDLDAGKKDSAELLFEIPETATDDTYNMEVTITGENEDTNEEYEIILKFDVNVEKKSHDLRIDKAELTPATVSCERTSELYLKVRNFGKNEEDEIRVTVENAALGIKFEEKDIDIDSDIDEYWTKIIPIDAKNLAAGDYKISTKVYYDEDKLYDIKDVILTVQKCVTAEEQPAQEPAVIVVTPTTGTAATPAAATGATTGSDVTETFEAGFFESTNMVPILLIVGIAVVVVLIILLMVLAFRR